MVEWLDNIRKTMEKISHGNDYVVFNDWINIWLDQKIQNRLNLSLAIWRTKAHEFTVTQDRYYFDLISILELFNDVFNQFNPFLDKRVFQNFLRQKLNSFNFPFKLSLNSSHHLIQLFFFHLLILVSLFELNCFDLIFNGIKMD